MISLGASDVFIVMCVIFAVMVLAYHVGRDLGSRQQEIADRHYYTALMEERERERGH